MPAALVTMATRHGGLEVVNAMDNDLDVFSISGDGERHLWTTIAVDDDANAVVREMIDEIKRLAAARDRIRQSAENLGALPDDDFALLVADLVDSLELSHQTSACSHCKERIPADEGGSIREHTMTCQASPLVRRLAAAETQLAAATENLAAAREERDRLRVEVQVYRDTTPAAHAAEVAALHGELARMRDGNRGLRAELAEERGRLLAEEERRKLTGDALSAEAEVRQLRAEVESARKIVTAILAGNETLRDKLEAADRLIHAASEEIDRLKQPEARWYEHAMKLLATAPNFVSASFDMGGRRAEIVFYQAGGKTPGEVASELRAEVESMRPVVEAARVYVDLGGLDGDEDMDEAQDLRRCMRDYSAALATSGTGRAGRWRAR